jgi:hypothetical protein
VCAATNEYLDGARSYAAHQPEFANVSSLRNPTQNRDGSFDIVIGPDQPDDPHASWIATDPAKGWFALFPFYGPPRGYINRTWKLGDLTPI